MGKIVITIEYGDPKPQGAHKQNGQKPQLPNLPFPNFKNPPKGQVLQIDPKMIEALAPLVNQFIPALVGNQIIDQNKDPKTEEK